MNKLKKYINIETREEERLRIKYNFSSAAQSKILAGLSDVISLIPHRNASYTLLYSCRMENARQSSPRTINNRLRSKVTPISGGSSK